MNWSELLGLNSKIVFLLKYFKSFDRLLVGIRCKTSNGLWMEVGGTGFDRWLQGCYLSLVRYWQDLLLQRHLWQHIKSCFTELTLCHLAITNIFHMFWVWSVSSPTLSWHWKRLDLTLERKSFPWDHQERVHHCPLQGAQPQMLQVYGVYGKDVGDLRTLRSP